MNKIELRAVNTIRTLSVDAIEKANSGHPGMPMGAAPMAYTLWSKFLKGSGKNPNWPDRDRFVLSAGHGSMLLYSLLHMFGYDVSIEDIKNFRQLGSKTPGHPEYGHTPGVETTTGPLGQGISTAVGMALAEKKLAAEFNTGDFNIVDHFTYTIVGDGDLMEGISSEAASLAGHLQLGKLIALYDDNQITIEGSTDITFTEDVGKRFEAYGWEVISVEDGNSIEDIEKAIMKAKENTNKPTLIKISTVIGYGSPNKAGKSSVHGSPLGKEEIVLAKKELEWDSNPDFHVPDDVRSLLDKIIDEKDQERLAWEQKLEKYRSKYPDMAKKWDLWHSNELPEELLKDETIFNLGVDSIATRKSSGKIMNIIANHLPNFIGGSADLSPSTITYLNDKGDFSVENLKGNNINFGIREHAMGAILNGMALHGGMRVFGSTFLVFSNYMLPSVRLSALMNLPVVYVFTHDSIGVGEDGPTHQPIEHVVSLRSMPNINVFRPADANETAVAWIEALTESHKPSALILSRQNLPTLKEVNEDAHKGGYILIKEEKETPDAILIGTGSEVSLLVEAHHKLKEDGIDTRVVSLLSWELYEQQSDEYKNNVLPPNVTKRLSCEAGSTLGWAKYTGIQGKAIGIDTFGASAPGNVVMKEFGFSVDNVIREVKNLF